MSISQHELSNINDSVPTAVIYAKNDLFGYTVEIRHQGQSRFLMETGTGASVYASIEQAKRAARSAGAKQAYAAYDTVYDETGTESSQAGRPRFDYQPVDLTTYY